MKPVQPCVVENCIPTPSSCNDWNGGDIEFLGICNGDSLNNVIWEIIGKLQDLAGEDLSSYDLDSLLDICNQKAPAQTNLISILNVLKQNQICLKDYIDNLAEIVNTLAAEKNINVNLRCFADFDNLGNSLAITRESLDQLVINNLCSHKDRLDSVEGAIVEMRNDIANIDRTTTVEELDLATCVDGAIKPTSSQLQAVAEAHCNLEGATGDAADIATAMSLVPSDWNTKYNLLTGWDMSIGNQAELIGNMILIISNLEARVAFMEENCCASTCEDVKLGFTAIFNEDGDGVIIRFTSGAGTIIPSGFTDKGSTGTITDVDGNVQDFTLSIANNYEVEVPISGLNTLEDLVVDITAKMGTDALTCEKCLHKVVKGNPCAYCTYTASGDVTIIYKICN
jgi:hypothetical protein